MRPSIGPRLLLAFGAIALLALVPLLVKSPYALHLFILVFSTVALGSAWNVIGGYGGQYSVGHAAWFGVGAYSAMILLHDKHIPPWFGVWPGVAIAMVAAVIVGSITFRLRGPYFVLASIAVAEIFRLAALNWKTMTNGAEGILSGDTPPFDLGPIHIEFNGKVPYYYMGLFLAAAALFAGDLVRRSRLGYQLQAIREDQDAAHSLGIAPTRTKNLGLVISAGFTALVGAFTANYTAFVDPQSVLGIDVSIQIVLVCIIGGVGTVLGPLVGAVVLVLLSEALRSNLIASVFFAAGLPRDSPMGSFMGNNLAHAHVLVYGILVVLVILFMPDGVMGFFRNLAARKRATAAAAATPEPR